MRDFLFLDKGFNYELCLSNGCHDFIKKAMNINDVAIISVKGIDYRIHFRYMSKHDALNIMKNSDLIEKVASYTFLLYKR